MVHVLGVSTDLVIVSKVEPVQSRMVMLPPPCDDLSMVCLSQEGVRSCLDSHGYTTDEVVIDERKSACRGLKCFEDASDHSDGSWLEAFGSRCEASKPGNHPGGEAIPRR